MGKLLVFLPMSNLKRAFYKVPVTEYIELFWFFKTEDQGSLQPQSTFHQAFLGPLCH